MPHTVLDHLWANALTQRNPMMLSPIPRLLGKLLPFPVIALSTALEAGTFKATAAFADEELLPGASLADMLFEECDIEVPGDAVIYIETTALASCKDMHNPEITKLLGELVLKLATRTPTTTMKDATSAETDVVQFSGDTTRDARLGDVVQ